MQYFIAAEKWNFFVHSEKVAIHCELGRIMPYPFSRFSMQTTNKRSFFYESNEIELYFVEFSLQPTVNSLNLSRRCLAECLQISIEYSVGREFIRANNGNMLSCGFLFGIEFSIIPF